MSSAAHCESRYRSPLSSQAAAAAIASLADASTLSANLAQLLSTTLSKSPLWKSAVSATMASARSSTSRVLGEMPLAASPI